MKEEVIEIELTNLKSFEDHLFKVIDENMEELINSIRCYENEQEYLLKIIEEFDHTPSLSQAQQMRRLIKMNKLTEEIIEDILSEEKPNQLPKIHISYDSLRRYVPKKLVTPKEIEAYLIKCAIVCMKRGINIERLKVEVNGELLI